MWRHARALYVNIPVDEVDIEHLIKPPCVLDTFNDKCWISIVVDDLDVLEAHCAAGMFMSTPLSGWMMKLNILVRCSVPTWNDTGTTTVAGYQIVEVHFEDGLGGKMKALGARLTQKVPSTTLQFEMSSGSSGTAFNSELRDALLYSATVSDKSNCRLLALTGSLKTKESATSPLQPFLDFVINRPHKFLFQKDNNCLAYAPETGEGAEFSTEGCALVSADDLAVPLLERIGKGFSEKLRIDDAVCFVQPYYILVDHHNTVIS